MDNKNLPALDNRSVIARASMLEKYMRRYKRAKSTADQWAPLLEACQHFCIPFRNLFYYSNQTQGQQKNVKVYDTTQVAATRAFVAKVQTALTPPQQTWSYLEAEEDLNEDFYKSLGKNEKEFSDYLQRTTDKIFNFIRRSNFDLAVHECYYDLAVGTAALVILPGDKQNPLRFHSIPLAQFAAEESINGTIDSSYRTYGEVRICDIEQMWPTAILPAEMRQRLEEDPGATVKNLYEGVIYNYGKELPYTLAVWTDNELLVDEDMESSPWVVWRWNKTNNETMGRGVIMDALPSIISLNEQMRLELGAANLNVCKPYMAYSDGVFNAHTFKLEPNTIIPISPNSAGQFPIMPLPDTANPAFMQMTAVDLRNQINKLMYADPLGPVEAPTRTATELALRQRNLAEEIGPLFTRLQQEFLSRVIDRVIYILRTTGAMEFWKVDKRAINLKYKSPLTVAQGQQNVSTFLEYYQLCQGIAGPEQAQMLVNPIKLYPWMAKQLGVNSEVINGEDQITQALKIQKDKQDKMEALAMQQGGMSV